MRANPPAGTRCSRGAWESEGPTLLLRCRAAAAFTELLLLLRRVEGAGLALWPRPGNNSVDALTGSLVLCRG